MFITLIPFLKDSDPTYASQMLDVAKELYDFADQRRQNYDVSIPGAADFYKWVGEGEGCS